MSKKEKTDFLEIEPIFTRDWRGLHNPTPRLAYSLITIRVESIFEVYKRREKEKRIERKFLSKILENISERIAFEKYLEEEILSFLQG